MKWCFSCKILQNNDPHCTISQTGTNEQLTNPVHTWTRHNWVRILGAKTAPFGDVSHCRTLSQERPLFATRSQVKQSRIGPWVLQLLIKDTPQKWSSWRKFLTLAHPLGFYFWLSVLDVGHTGCLTLYTGRVGFDFGGTKQDSGSWHSHFVLRLRGQDIHLWVVVYLVLLCLSVLTLDVGTTHRLDKHKATSWECGTALMDGDEHVL
jgi:hypothetical protein